MHFTNNYRAHFMLLSVGVFWGLTPLWVRAASVDMLSTITVRALISGLVLLMFRWRYVAKIRGRPLAKLREYVVVGGLACISTSAFAAAFLVADVGNVYVIYYTFPLWSIMLMAITRRKMPSALQYTALVIGIIGLMVTLSDAITLASIGIGELLALLSALAWAAHIFVAQSQSTDEETLTANIVGQLLLAVILVPFVTPSLTQIATQTSLVYLIGLGFTSGLALLCWSAAIRHVPGHVAGSITMLEAPLGLAVFALAIGEQITLRTIVGGSLVLGSFVLLTCRVEKRE